ncbi:hypothetical protein [Vibrio phage JSF12]|uniref:Uncharacterized protein n=2 Tax=Jesfedecavirus TaxID=2560156 RepID=A0A2D0Z639_9CAUD|nr:hypothetical protein FDI98_gp127 [Vibrio phage JSF10]YP_009794707.1 hypothetical protein HOS35_gp024 [Vibrio phage JSF12]ASV43405.1 hypothetical protein [Vibrio phage JSF10]ASV43542.1 hypothetical protein [Vibrio phage JSF12]
MQESLELLVRQLEALLKYQSTLIEAKASAVVVKNFTVFEDEINKTRNQIDQVFLAINSMRK